MKNTFSIRNIYILINFIIVSIIFSGCANITIGTDETFVPRQFTYDVGEISQAPVDADGNVIGGAEKDLNNNIIHVKSWIEGRTGNVEKDAWAWQQLGIKYKVKGPAGGFRLARVTYKIDYGTQNSATGTPSTKAEGWYSCAYGTYEKPDTPYEIVSTSQPGRLPIIARIPPNQSEFHHDAQNDLTFSETGVRFEVGKTYISIIQVKAWSILRGEGSAHVEANNKDDQMVLKEIKIEWL